MLRGISGVRSISASPVCEATMGCLLAGLPACLPASHPAPSRRGSRTCPLVSPPRPVALQPADRQPSLYLVAAWVRVKGEIARPCLEWRPDRECSALSFPGDIAIRALLPFVFVHRSSGLVEEEKREEGRGRGGWYYNRLPAFNMLQRVSASW